MVELKYAWNLKISYMNIMQYFKKSVSYLFFYIFYTLVIMNLHIFNKKFKN